MKDNLSNTSETSNKFISDFSKKEFLNSEKILLSEISTIIIDFIISKHKTLTQQSIISKSELNIFRQQSITKYFEINIQKLKDVQTKLVENENEIDIYKYNEISLVTNYTTGQKIADRVASFGGSWRFIILFGLFIFFWILINIVLFIPHYDPYPYILLNLILSCLAALQAPVIMMSQNRVEEKDRQQAKEDYIINMKSEKKIQLLHQKIDNLIVNQQAELIEIQKIQIEIMNEILEKIF